MKMQKCPRCELNYVRPGEKYCSVCAQKLSAEQLEDQTLCAECGENIAMKGQELCRACLVEKLQREAQHIPAGESGEDILLEDLPELDEEIPAEELAEIQHEMGDDERAAEDSAY